MNTNNKEAIKAFWDDLDKLTFLHDWSLKEKSDIVQLFKAYLTVLQDNDDTEVQEETCKYAHTSSPGAKYCEDCGEPMTKPSSKVEKLKELKKKLINRNTDTATLSDVLDLIDILLIEDEE